jgi:hypothetical protein
VSGPPVTRIQPGRPGACAQFFGGQTSSSPYALLWQWSGGGGVSNGVGDFDTIDAIKQN